MTLFSEALDIQTKRQDTHSMIQILNLLGNLHLQQGNTGDMMKCFVESSRLNEAIAASQADGEIMDTTSIPVFSACLNFHFMSKLHPPAAPQAWSWALHYREYHSFFLTACTMLTSEEWRIIVIVVLGRSRSASRHDSFKHERWYWWLMPLMTDDCRWPHARDRAIFSHHNRHRYFLNLAMYGWINRLWST